MTSEGIQLEVYRDTDPHTMAAVLDARVTPQVLEEVEGPGSGTFWISKNDPKILEDPTLLDYRNFVRFRVNGKVVGGSIIQTKKTTIVDSAEYSGEAWEISGEGLRGWFRDAAVYPYKGVLKPTSKTSRFFNFSVERGHWYDDNAWESPVPWEKWNSGGRKKFYPADWPDAKHAYWTWSDDLDPSTKYAPKGYVYFRAEFEVKYWNAGEYSLFFAIDDQADVYVDGELLMTTADHAWREVNRLDFELDTGTHIIAFKGYNYRNDGYGGLLAALFRAGDASAPTAASIVLSSGNTSKWQCLPYPETEPGWTVGAVLLTLLSEAEGRGVRFAQNITPTFTESLDSYGKPWRDPLPWEFNVGASYADVLSALEETECDVWLNPDTLELNVYNKRGADLSIEGGSLNPAVFRPGQNILVGNETGQAAIANTVVMHTPSGWVDATPDTFPGSEASQSRSAYGRVETGFSTSLDGKAARNAVSGLFESRSLPETSATFTIHPRPEDFTVPFEDIYVGDWVSAPDHKGNLVRRRIVSISVVENAENGDPVYAVEFDTIFQDRQTEMENALSRATGGSTTLGGFGESQVALPDDTIYGPPAKEVTLATPDAPLWVTTTDTGVWTSQGLPSAHVNLVWTEVTTSGGDAIEDVIGYEVWGRRANEVDSEEKLLETVTTPSAELRFVPSGEDWVYRVRAIGRVNGEGLFSGVWPHTASFPVEELQAPSDPTFATGSALVGVVQWDGLLGGNLPPTSFRRVYAEYRQAGETDWNRTAAFATKSGQVATIPGAKDVTFEVRLIAEDALNRLSDPSGVVSTTLTGVYLVDLDISLSDAIEGAQSDAAQALEDASLAQTTADGKNSIYRSDTAPTGDFVPGDLWYELNAEGNVVGIQTWNGTAWTTMTVVADEVLVPGSVGPTRISENGITTTHLSTEDIWASNAWIEQAQVGVLTSEIIEVNMLSPAVGESLDLSANESINFIVGPVEESASAAAEAAGVAQGTADAARAEIEETSIAVNATKEDLEELSTYYRFGPEGAEIGSPGSSYTFHMSNSRADFRVNGSATTYWEHDIMYVSEAEVDTITMANHQVASYGNRTIIRKI